MLNSASRYITLAIGTSNDEIDETWTVTTNREFGVQWAQMITRLHGSIVNAGIQARVDIHGAINIETNFNTASNTRAWVDGYDSVNTRRFYNFGDAGGCSLTSPNNDQPCNNGWNQSDVWYVSWGAGPALPLPEIYLNNGAHAAQWQKIGLYSVLHQFQGMIFPGVLTTWLACQQVYDEDCPEIDNTPQQGWSQLLFALNSDTRTFDTLREWASDISWR